MSTVTWRSVSVLSLVNVSCIMPLIGWLQGHHYAEITSVFGLDREEFDCLTNAGLKIKPSKFEKSEDRFQVVASWFKQIVVQTFKPIQIHCSPWTIMRHLSYTFGYELPSMPIGGEMITLLKPDKLWLNRSYKFGGWGEENLHLYNSEKIALQCETI